MAVKNYSEMTIKELLAENRKLQEKREAIHADQKEIAKTIDLKLAEQKVAGLTEAEKASLKQALA